MNMEKIFKNLALANILITIVYLIFFIFFDTDYDVSEEDAEFLLSDLIFGIIAMVYVIGFVYCHYLLYKFKPLGKKIFLPIVLFNILLYAILFVDSDMTSLTTSNLDVFIEWITGLISGCLLIFIYFTPIKDKFIKH
jgi:hypothetical protein